MVPCLSLLVSQNGHTQSFLYSNASPSFYAPALFSMILCTCPILHHSVHLPYSPSFCAPALLHLFDAFYPLLDTLANGCSQGPWHDTCSLA